MQRVAIIDIGSNSARLVIINIYGNKAYNMIFNQKEALRLSQKIDVFGNFTKEAFQETMDTMHSFAYMCKLYQAERIVAVATAAIRTARNGSDLVDQVIKETGINLHMIPGTTEAHISYLGVINTIDVKDGLIFDLGGGSTELILFRDRKVVNTVSLPFGAVNMTSMFNTKDTLLPGVAGDFNFFVASQLAKFPWIKDSKLPLIGVGGTARTAGKMIQRAKHYPLSKIHNYSFSAQNFRLIYKKLLGTSYAQRKKIPGLSADRADIILAGTSIINCLFEGTGSKKLIVSGCGLRDGLFYDYYSKAEHTELIAPDILKASTLNILNLYANDVVHSQHVCDLSLAMFDGWAKLHGLPKGDRRLLETAALLHDIGITINYYSHARHSAYMILNAKLFGLTHKEQMIVAAIAGWHNGIAKGYFKEAAFKDMLTDKEWNNINKCALILALAEGLDYSETHRISRIEASTAKSKANLKLYSKGPAGVEQHQIELLAPWFTKTMGVSLAAELNIE